MHSLTLSDDGDEPPIIDTSKLINKALKNIYKNRGGKGSINPSLFRANNEPLQQGIDKTVKAAGVEFGKKNEGFIRQFKHNTAVFAAFKSHKEHRELSKLILNEKEDLRSFSEFKKLAKPVVKDYNKVWLKTEYDTVVRSARMAANWKIFEERKDIFPNIQYMMTRAMNPRPEHLAWVGIILPMDDPFWITHVPPVAWGCECWIRQTREAATGHPDTDAEEIPEVFKNNPGKTAQFINIDKHPYAIAGGLSRKEAEAFVNNQLNDAGILDYIKEAGIGKDGGELLIHPLSDKTHANRVIGEALANTGHKVKLLPDIQPEQKQLRKELLPKGVKENKNPDAMIDGHIFEFKTLRKNTYNAVSQELKYAGKQSDYVLLNIEGVIDQTIMNRAIRGRIKMKENIKEVWVMLGGKLVKYTREFILSDEFGK